MVIASSSHAFTGGRILTMDPTVAQAEVVITVGERIVAVGERGLLADWPDAEVIDLGGRILRCFLVLWPFGAGTPNHRRVVGSFAGLLLTPVGQARGSGGAQPFGALLADHCTAAVVLVFGGHVANAGVQSDGVVVEPDPFEFALEHGRVGDLLQLGPFVLDVAEEAFDVRLVGDTPGRPVWQASQCNISHSRVVPDTICAPVVQKHVAGDFEPVGVQDAGHH